MRKRYPTAPLLNTQPRVPSNEARERMSERGACLRYSAVRQLFREKIQKNNAKAKHNAVKKPVANGTLVAIDCQHLSWKSVLCIASPPPRVVLNYRCGRPCHLSSPADGYCRFQDLDVDVESCPLWCPWTPVRNKQITTNACMSHIIVQQVVNRRQTHDCCVHFLCPVRYTMGGCTVPTTYSTYFVTCYSGTLYRNVGVVMTKGKLKKTTGLGNSVRFPVHRKMSRGEHRPQTTQDSTTSEGTESGARGDVLLIVHVVVT